MGLKLTAVLTIAQQTFGYSHTTAVDSIGVKMQRNSAAVEQLFEGELHLMHGDVRHLLHIFNHSDGLFTASSSKAFNMLYRCHNPPINERRLTVSRVGSS